MPDVGCADSGGWYEYVRDEFEHVRCVLWKNITLRRAQPCKCGNHTDLKPPFRGPLLETTVAFLRRSRTVTQLLDLAVRRRSILFLLLQPDACTVWWWSWVATYAYTVITLNVIMT